jgi:hypothetical protein
MTNPNERNSEEKQPKPTDTADQYRKNPTPESGQHEPKPKQQDPSKKDPSQVDDSRQRDRDASEQVEKRRA